MRSLRQTVHLFFRTPAFFAFVAALPASAHAQQVSLEEIVTPSTVIAKEGRTITFALHGFIEFKSLAEVFPYIESQSRRWPGAINGEERRTLARDLLRRGVERPVVFLAAEGLLETFTELLERFIVAFRASALELVSH